MSRNLCQSTCHYCETELVLVEKPRPITPNDARGYYTEYQGMTVANADCPACEAKYLAWLDGSKRNGHYKNGYGIDVQANKRPECHFNPSGDFIIQDTSFRSTFNDEPGPDDLPKWKVKVQWVRVRPWKS
jgi:hypothetical protein